MILRVYPYFCCTCCSSLMNLWQETQQNKQQNRWVAQNKCSNLTQALYVPIWKGIKYSTFCNTWIHIQSTVVAFPEYCTCTNVVPYCTVQVLLYLRWFVIVYAAPPLLCSIAFVYASVPLLVQDQVGFFIDNNNNSSSSKQQHFRSNAFMSSSN